MVFTGAGDPISYTADDEDRILIDRARMDQLPTIQALREHFDAADFVVPPLQISG